MVFLYTRTRFLAYIIVFILEGLKKNKNKKSYILSLKMMALKSLSRAAWSSSSTVCNPGSLQLETCVNTQDKHSC